MIEFCNPSGGDSLSLALKFAFVKVSIVHPFFWGNFAITFSFLRLRCSHLRNRSDSSMSHLRNKSESSVTSYTSYTSTGAAASAAASAATEDRCLPHWVPDDRSRAASAVRRGAGTRVGRSRVSIRPNAKLS